MYLAGEEGFGRVSQPPNFTASNIVRLGRFFSGLPTGSPHPLMLCIRGFYPHPKTMKKSPNDKCSRTFSWLISIAMFELILSKISDNYFRRVGSGRPAESRDHWRNYKVSGFLMVLPCWEILCLQTLHLLYSVAL